MSTRTPTEGLLAILNIRWRHGESMTVHDLHRELLQAKDAASRTVLKMFAIMAEKGLVRRGDSERRHRHTAAYSKPAVQRSLLDILVQRAFDGSAAKLVQHALGNARQTAAELDEIERVIAQAPRVQCACAPPGRGPAPVPVAAGSGRRAGGAGGWIKEVTSRRPEPAIA